MNTTKLLATGLLLCIGGFANAATTVTIGNSSFFGTPTPGFEGFSVTDVNGVLTPFSLAVGTLSEGSFLQNGSTFNAAASFTWTHNITNALVPAGANPFFGNEILVMISTSEGSSIFNTGVNWANEDAILGGSATVNIRNQAFDSGQIVDFSSTPTAPNQKLMAFSTSPIPEPSVALLGAFGVLGLLRRRR